MLKTSKIENSKFPIPMSYRYSSNYYPFGSTLPTRSWSNASRAYRFGFNTQEKDNEIAGEGNSFSAEFWQIDTRLGRRFNIDPISQIYLSDYSVLGNSPILFMDLLGNRFEIGAEHVEVYKNKVTERKSFLDKRISTLDEKLSKQKNEKRRQKTQNKIDELKEQSNELGSILCEIDALKNSSNTYDFIEGGNNYTDGNGNTEYNPDNGHITINFGNEGALAHELVHAYQGLTGKLSFNKEFDTYNVGFLYDYYDEEEAYQRSMFYSKMFENENDANSFYNKYLQVTGSDIINNENLIKWNNKQGGHLDELPLLRLNTNSLVNETSAAEETKTQYGKLTYEAWQKYLRKNSKYDTHPSSIEQYNEVKL